MDPGSDETDARLARRLARDTKKEDDPTEKDQKTDEDSALNPTFPPKEQQAGCMLDTTGTSYPVVDAASAASPAAFQGSMPEFVQALMQMDLSQADCISALCELQLIEA